MKLLYALGFLLTFGFALNAQSYKEMMNDTRYTFQEVVAAAEKHFESHEKGKGSGYKAFLRWKYQNEGKYGPSGIRENIDPQFAQKGYLEFKQQFEHNNKTNSTSAWKDLGPYNADSVTSHYSEGVGRVITFYVDPNNEGKIYLGARGGGFWKSLDTGKTWVNTTDFLITSGVASITASPTNSDSVLIALRNADNGSTHGIYRSIDGGNTWDSTAFTPANLGWGGLGTRDAIYTVKISPHISDLVLVGSSEGLHVSHDNLQTWTSTNNAAQAIEFHPTDPAIIYVVQKFANTNQLLLSTDTGHTFSFAGIISANSSNNTYIATSAAAPNNVYIASNDGVWRSTNQGTSFTYLVSAPSTIRGFAVSDQNKNNHITGYVDGYRSDNEAFSFYKNNWWYRLDPNTTDSNYIHADIRVVDYISGSFYIGTDGYLCKSTDEGQTWTRFQGYGIRENYRVGVSQSKQKLNMVGSQDNGTSIVDNNGWFEWNGGDGMEAVIQPLNEKWMIGSWQFGNRNRTVDGGLTRQNVPHGGSPNWDAPMFMDPNDHMRVFSFAQEVYRTDDFAGNWTQLGSPAFATSVRDGAIAENNSDIIALASYNDIALSIDGGMTFTDITNTQTNQYVSDVAFDPNRDSTIIITYAHHWNADRIYISHDLGSTWQNITSNLNKMPVHCARIDQDGNIYLGAELGVYTKKIGDNNWTLYNQNLPNVAVKELEIQYATNTLRAATWGRGLYEAPLKGKESHPKIVDIETTVKPDDTNPMHGVPNYVEAMVSYPGVISKCYIQWSINNLDFDHNLTMTNTVDSTWRSDQPLPDSIPGTKVFFKVIAVAANGDSTTSYKLMYTLHSNPSINVVENQVSSFKVYPNPTQGKLAIDFEMDQKIKNILILDAAGREVMRVKQPQGPSFELNVESLETGSYILKVNYKDRTESLTFIKQ